MVHLYRRPARRVKLFEDRGLPPNKDLQALFKLESDPGKPVISAQEQGGARLLRDFVPIIDEQVFASCRELGTVKFHRDGECLLEGLRQSEADAAAVEGHWRLGRSVRQIVADLFAFDLIVDDQILLRLGVFFIGQRIAGSVALGIKFALVVGPDDAEIAKFLREGDDTFQCRRKLDGTVG